jgi:hypothetical protein
MHASVSMQAHPDVLPLLIVFSCRPAIRTAATCSRLLRTVPVHCDFRRKGDLVLQCRTSPVTHDVYDESLTVTRLAATLSWR